MYSGPPKRKSVAAKCILCGERAKLNGWDPFMINPKRLGVHKNCYSDFGFCLVEGYEIVASLEKILKLPHWVCAKNFNKTYFALYTEKKRPLIPYLEQQYRAFSLQKEVLRIAHPILIASHRVESRREMELRENHVNHFIRVVQEDPVCCSLFFPNRSGCH